MWAKAHVNERLGKSRYENIKYGSAIQLLIKVYIYILH